MSNFIVPVITYDIKNLFKMTFQLICPITLHSPSLHVNCCKPKNVIVYFTEKILDYVNLTSISVINICENNDKV